MPQQALLRVAIIVGALAFVMSVRMAFLSLPGP